MTVTEMKMMTLAALLVESLFASTIAAGDLAAAVSENGPRELPLRTSVSQYGITWTFDKPAPVGQFINGDYYVVGPVMIVSITPQPVYAQTPGDVRARNGSVLNLPPNGLAGFDGRITNNKPAPGLVAGMPVKMTPNDSLLSTISVEKLRSIPNMLRPEDRSAVPVRTAAVLTCMDAAVPEDAFRPSYCDTSNQVFLARNLRRERLPRLPRVASTPELSTVERYFERPWIDTVQFGFAAPMENMVCYGREYGRAAGIAGLMLCCDFQPQEKEKLLIRFVQLGIDLWGVVRAGHHGWPAHGGHGSGRKLPIVLAGLLLDEQEMQCPTVAFPAVKFQEDMQTMYGKGWTGATALYAGHQGVTGNQAIGWGPFEHLHPSRWKSTIGENYRRCCTSVAWVGQALTLRILRAEKTWRHDAFFDYVDRWMTPDDPQLLEELMVATGNRSYALWWARQGQAWDPFVNDMWAQYRHSLP